MTDDRLQIHIDSRDAETKIANLEKNYTAIKKRIENGRIKAGVDVDRNRIVTAVKGAIKDAIKNSATTVPIKAVGTAQPGSTRTSAASAVSRQINYTTSINKANQTLGNINGAMVRTIKEQQSITSGLRYLYTTGQQQLSQISNIDSKLGSILSHMSADAKIRNKRASKTGQLAGSSPRAGTISLNMDRLRQEWANGIKYLDGKSGGASAQKKVVFQDIDLDKFRGSLKSFKDFVSFVALHEVGHIVNRHDRDYKKAGRDLMHPLAINAEKEANSHAFRTMGINEDALKKEAKTLSPEVSSTLKSCFSALIGIKQQAAKQVVYAKETATHIRAISGNLAHVDSIATHNESQASSLTKIVMLLEAAFGMEVKRRGKPRPALNQKKRNAPGFLPSTTSAQGQASQNKKPQQPGFLPQNQQTLQTSVVGFETQVDSTTRSMKSLQKNQTIASNERITAEHKATEAVKKTAGFISNAASSQRNQTRAAAPGGGGGGGAGGGGAGGAGVGATTTTNAAGGGNAGGGPRRHGGNGFDDVFKKNPLLKLIEYWGVSASGMAATLFLTQMLGSYAGSLMNVIKEWETAIEGLIDVTGATRRELEPLTNNISQYARELNIGRSALSQAGGATLQYGISPIGSNIEQMYGLQMAGGVKDYREAATIIAMAGTEFGDRVADQYLKKYEATVGKDNGSGIGTLGHEFQGLLNAGKEGLMHIWSKEGTHYGENLKKLMKELNGWIVNNRQSLGEMFDIGVTGIRKIGSALAWAIPGLTAFSTVFVGGWGLRIGYDVLSKISGVITGMNGPLATLAEGATGLSGAFFKLGPALLATAAAWGAWEIGKKVYQARKLKNELQDAKTLTQQDYENQSQAQRTQKETDNAARVLKAQNEILELQKKIARVKKETEVKNGPRGGYNPEAASQLQIAQNDLKKNQEIVKEFSEANKKIGKATDSVKLGFYDLPKAFPEFQKGIQILQQVNQELGYMPKLLGQIKAAQREVDSKDVLGATDLGTKTLLNYTAKFKDSLELDPKKKQQYELGLHQESIARNGMNTADRSAAQFRAIKEMMLTDLAEFRQHGDSEGITAIANAFQVLAKVLLGFKTESATIEMNKLSTAIKNMNNDVSRMDMTAYEKAIDKIRTEYKGNTSQLEAGQRAILTDQLEDKLSRWAAKDPTLPGKIRDIKNSNLSRAQQKVSIDYLNRQQQILKNERRLVVEREKGHKYATAYQISLETQNKLLKLQSSYELGRISEKTYKRRKDYFEGLGVFQKAVNQAKANEELGSYISSGKGFTSETEKMARIDKRKMEMQKFLHASKYFNQYYDKEQLTWLEKHFERVITLQEQIKQLQSEIAFSSAIDKKAGIGMSDQTYKARAGLIKERLQQMSDENVSIERQEGFQRNETFKLEQDRLFEQQKIWKESYSQRGVMSQEFYDNERAKIENQYKNDKKNKSLGVGQADEARKLALKELDEQGRKLISLNRDLELSGQSVVNTLTQQYQTLGQIMERSLTQAFNGTVNAMTSVIMQTKSAKEAFKDMAKSILTDLTRMIMKQMLFSSLFGNYQQSGTMGGLVGLGKEFIMGFASGGVLSGKGISSMRNSVVNSPIMFPDTSIHKYASGTAMIGEAGYEGVLPLTRMPSGNLGVEAAGAGQSEPGINIEINIENKTGSNITATQSQPKFDGKKFVVTTILEAASKNSGFQKSMKSALGATR